MPRLTLTTKDNPGDDWVRIARRASNPTAAEQRTVEAAIREQFARNFAREGSGAGAWAPLAPSTVAQRLREGFPGAHPILQRRGDFRRTYTDGGNSDTHYTFVQTASGWDMYVGSDDERDPWHFFGTSRMPARRVTDLDGGQAGAVQDAIDQLLAAIVRQETSR